MHSHACPVLHTEAEACAKHRGADRLRLNDIPRPVELSNVAADTVIRREIPVTEDFSISGYLELHIGFEQAADRVIFTSGAVADTHELMQGGRRTIQQGGSANRLKLSLGNEQA